MRRETETGAPSAGKPSSESGEGGGDKANANSSEFVEAKRAGAPADPVAPAAARPGETLSDDVGAGIVPRPSARASTRSPARRRPGLASMLRRAEGLWRSGAKRRRGVARSVPSARQRPGGQCGRRQSRRPARRGRSERRARVSRRPRCAAAPPRRRRRARVAEAHDAESPAPSAANPPAPDAAAGASNSRVQPARRLE